ncbi:MAG: S1/P1 Nuclease [Flavobacteriaceae bacterium]|nr:S1/P1 Nuclease [Flavobacteriaceae bacterium]|tara:strand:- start:2492 stop:3268 length:777 start_codon:yes stop_codon:yes gene_type:complete
MRQFFTVFLLVFVVNTGSATDFWGQNGHRVTGKIAEKHLSNRAKRKIDKLLKGQSLAFVSTYADEIKSDKKYRKFSPWHYVNFPIGGTYDPSKRNPQGDIIYGIEYCVKVLKNENSSEEDKIFYLKMLVHLVGDLHQPLHIGRAEDKGGNDIQVRWYNDGTNLHSVWDTKMIESFNMSYIELANNAKRLNRNQVKAIQKGSVLDWVYETRKLTEKVYASAQVGQKLRYRYSYEYFPIVRQQLQRGGIRLAKILNDIFG